MLHRMDSSSRPPYLLAILVLTQFAGTSLWFAGNAVLFDLERDWGIGAGAIGDATSAVQLGFIAGSLLFALLVITDRIPARRLFLASTLLGAGANLALLILPEGLTSLLATRFATGFFLAGIYPVGMKIAASWYQDDLGRALGFLIGALVLGTAFPHLLRGAGADLAWQQVVAGVSVLAAAGGLALYALVPDGPHLPKISRFEIGVVRRVFASRTYRASAFGYFGHMWELYALWAFAPLLLLAYNAKHGAAFDASLWTFALIAIGGVGCALGGIASRRFGSARIATAQLAISGACCVLAPLAFEATPAGFAIFLLVWGFTVVGDSPQFSALNAAGAPREYVGSALTITNSIGFFVTVVSIQLFAALLSRVEIQYLFWLLVPGPLFGLCAMRPLFVGAQLAR